MLNCMLKKIVDDGYKMKNAILHVKVSMFMTLKRCKK